MKKLPKTHCEQVYKVIHEIKDLCTQHGVTIRLKPCHKKLHFKSEKGRVPDRLLELLKTWKNDVILYLEHEMTLDIIAQRIQGEKFVPNAQKPFTITAPMAGPNVLFHRDQWSAILKSEPSLGNVISTVLDFGYTIWVIQRQAANGTLYDSIELKGNPNEPLPNIVWELLDLYQEELLVLYQSFIIASDMVEDGRDPLALQKWERYTGDAIAQHEESRCRALVGTLPINHTTTSRAQINLSQLVPDKKATFRDYTPCHESKENPIPTLPNLIQPSPMVSALVPLTWTKWTA